MAVLLRLHCVLLFGKVVQCNLTNRCTLDAASIRLLARVIENVIRHREDEQFLVTVVRGLYDSLPCKWHFRPGHSFVWLSLLLLLLAVEGAI